MEKTTRYYKQRIFEMLEEIKNPRFIRMIFGFVRGAYEEEKGARRIGTIDETMSAKEDCEA